MKTLTTEQFNALPEERRKYWKESTRLILPADQWHSQYSETEYVAVSIPLEDAERVLEEAMPKWVSVDETLPAFGKYLVYIQVLTNEPLIKTLMFYAERDNNQWEDYGQYITHWMLLPKSPTDDALTTALTI